MIRSILFLTTLLAASTAVASPEKPTDSELNDWTTYLRSVSLPVTMDACPAVLPADAGYADVARRWLESHGEAIKRGHDFAVAGNPKDRDFDQYIAAMLQDFKVKFLAKPAEVKLKLCKESLDALQKHAKGD